MTDVICPKRLLLPNFTANLLVAVGGLLAVVKAATVTAEAEIPYIQQIFPRHWQRSS